MRKATIGVPSFSPRDFSSAAAKQCGRLTEVDSSTGVRYRPEFPTPPADFDWGDGYEETKKKKKEPKPEVIDPSGVDSDDAAPTPADAESIFAANRPEL